MSLSPLKLLLASFATFASAAVASFALVGCAADDVASSDQDVEDVGVSQDEISSNAAKFVGRFEWRRGDSGAFVDFENLTLNADGTYSATVESSLTGGKIACITAPCSLPEEGKWSVFKSGGKTKIRFLPTGHPTRSYFASLADDLLSLTRYSETDHLFKVYTNTCANVRCNATTHCEMQGTGAAAHPACVPNTPEPACKKTGCSNAVCADHAVITTCIFRPEFACYQAGICERGADGQCGFRQTAELTQCIADATGAN